MPILFFLLIFTVLLYLFFKRDTVKSRKDYTIIITVVLLVFAGLRNQAVGSDTYAYLVKFDNVKYYSWSELLQNIVVGFFNPTMSEIGKDPAMSILNKLLSYIVSNHTVYLFITSAALLVPLGIFVYITCANLKQILFLYSCFISMNYSYLPCSAIRQSIALGILLLAYLALQEENVKKFIVLLLVSALFHKSVLIVLLLFLCFKFTKVETTYRLALIAFIFVFFFYNVLGTLFSDSGEIYEKYLQNTYYEHDGRSRPFVVVLLFLALYFIGLFKLRSIEFTKPSTRKLAILGTALTTVFVPLVRMDPTLIRISAYFVVWVGVLIPESISKYSRFIRSALFAVCILLFIYKSFSSGFDYAFFWQDMMLHERYL